MKCRLCLRESVLKNSHIIPEFQYKPLYDAKHRLNLISTDPKRRETLPQKGIREKLLCGDCETKLSQWEGYAQKVIFEDETQLVGKQNKLIRLGGVSYTEFKLYLMSLVWRMGVSTLDFFSHVNLGPYAEKLRLRLINGDPGQPHEYPCVITGILFNGNFEPAWISQPDLVKVDGVHCYRCVISGLLYTFFITERGLSVDASQISINKSGNFLMAIESLENIPFLRHRVIELAKALDERESNAAFRG